MINQDYSEDFKFDNVGEETIDELYVDLNRINQAVIWGTDWTAETINFQLVRGNIDLNPNFQRRDAWTDQDKSRLIESLMLNIPVPPIILAESKTKRNTYIVIDGKQRLLSIRRFYGSSEDFKPLKLSGLTVLKDLNGKTRGQIGEDRLRDFDNQTIRTIVIKNWPDESFLYTVFLRLNTGSKKLSPQELRQALKPGQFLDFLDDATANSDIIKRMLNNKNPDPRMKDVELALRYYAFKYYIEDFNGNLKQFLDLTCEEMNKGWELNKERYYEDFSELEKSIDTAYFLFENNSPFSRFEKGESSYRFNRSIFELFSYYFSDLKIRNSVLNYKDKFKKEFIELNDNLEFISAISDTTKDPIKVVKRFYLFANILSLIHDGPITTLNLVDGKIRKIALRR